MDTRSLASWSPMTGNRYVNFIDFEKFMFLYLGCIVILLVDIRGVFSDFGTNV